MTNPESIHWHPGDPGYRRSEVSAVIGRGEPAWARSTTDVLNWRVKTASGFEIDATGPVAEGERLRITARLLGISIIEPVEVVTVIKSTDRVGFAYKTLPGHPVSGEEAFIVHRDGEEVRLTVRSLTRPAPQQPWRALYPLLRIAQVIARKRYLRALR